MNNDSKNYQNILYSKKHVDNINNSDYNMAAKNIGGSNNEFRRIQNESRRMSSEELQSYRRGSKILDERERSRYRMAFQQEINSIRGSKHLKESTLVNSKSNNKLIIVENIDGNLFHNIFEIARNHLYNCELVDLHSNYDDAICYLSNDGLSGFAIENNGNLVSVFNLGEKGYLDTISKYINEKGATHLDCFNSPNQPLTLMYERKLGFKTASIMDYNMEYDHDDIAKNHGMP